MNSKRLHDEIYGFSERKPHSGYTLIEVLGVTAIIIIIVLMTQGMVKNYKRYSIEEIAVQRLKELSRYEHGYRYSSDPTVNPEASYGDFFDLQNAGFISEVYSQDDEKRHTVNAFVPQYRLEFVKSAEEDDQEPDSFNYMIMAIPLTNSLGLKTFYVQEDGEVYYQRYLWLQPR